MAPGQRRTRTIAGSKMLRCSSISELEAGPPTALCHRQHDQLSQLDRGRMPTAFLETTIILEVSMQAHTCMRRCYLLSAHANVK